MNVRHIHPSAAMVLSVAGDCIVHTSQDDAEFFALHQDGEAETEDEDGHPILEHWGVCEDGSSEWRVHVHPRNA